MRQKTEKVDNSKIDTKNKNTVKQACNQANKANRVLIAAKEEKKNTQTPTPKLSGLKDNNEEDSQNKEKSKQGISQETIEKAEKVKEESVKKLEEIKEKSNSSEEKSEIDKTIKNIKAEKQVELSNEKSEYLEGYTISIDRYKKFVEIINISYTNVIKFVTNENTTIIRNLGATIGKSDEELSRVQRRYKQLNSDEEDTGKLISDKRINQYLNDKDNRKTQGMFSYSAFKRFNNKISCEKLQQNTFKQKLKKSDVESEIAFARNQLKIAQGTTQRAQKICKDLVDTFEKIKQMKVNDDKLVNDAIKISTDYMKDMTLIVNDETKLHSIFIRSMSNFLITATPVEK